MPRANEVTQDHIVRVGELIGEVTKDLNYRAIYHDQSKFDPIESGPLQEMQDLIDKEGQAPFGSDEYRRRTALLGPMLEHHYANNRHHPEHFLNGIAGMTLVDLVEMVCDWKAASERGNDPALNLTYLAQKYDIGPMLLSILQNTCREKGWRHV